MFHIYRLSDGTFTGQSFSMEPWDEERAAAHIPVGCAAFAGRVDALSQRLNLTYGVLEDYQPAAPADTAMWTWRWSTVARRYEPVATLTALKASALDKVQAAMLANEALQARSARKVTIAMASGVPAPAVAIGRLTQIDAAAAALRLVRIDIEAAANAQALAAITWISP